MSCRSKTALSRHLAALRSRRASSRARVRSRMASSSTFRTDTGVRSPERISRASWTASRRAVLTRSPALLGKQRGRDDLTAMALFRQIAREPIPTGSCFIHKDQVCGLGLPLVHELVNVGLPGANRAEEDDLRVMRFGHLGHRHRLLMDIQSDIARARL
jgi:hypothetical protein